MAQARLLIGLIVALASADAYAACVGPIAKVTDCGGVGDARASKFVSTTIGMPVVTCPTCNWKSGDVGKIFWCIDAGTGGPVIAQTTVLSWQSATQITVNANAIQTLGGARCVWGTADDTAAIIAATAAVTSEDQVGIGLESYVGSATPGIVDACSPNGGYIVSSLFFSHLTPGTSPTLRGCGQDATVFFSTPAATLPLIILVGSGGGLQDFTVSGMNSVYASQDDVIRFIQAGGSHMTRVSIRDIGLNGAGSAALRVDGMNTGYFDQVVVQTASGLATANIATACVFNGSGAITVNQILCSNYKHNLEISNSGGRTPATNPMVFLGGLIDECGPLTSTTDACTRIINSTPTFFGTKFYGPSYTPYPTITVDGTSNVRFDDIDAGIYWSPGTGGALYMATGAKVSSSGSSWHANGGGKAIVNNGTFVDRGGNEYIACTNLDCVPMIHLTQAFQGNLPIRSEQIP